MSLTKVCEYLDPFFAHCNFIEYAARTTPPKKNATLKFIRNGAHDSYEKVQNAQEKRDGSLSKLYVPTLQSF